MSDKVTANQDKIVWKTSDGREIPIDQMDDDHLIKSLFRTQAKRESHQDSEVKIKKQIAKKQKELKKHSDLAAFFSELSDQLYDELKKRRLVFKYFAQFKPDYTKHNLRSEEETEERDVAE